MYVADVHAVLRDLYHVDRPARVAAHDLVALAQRQAHTELGGDLGGRRASRGPSKQAHGASSSRAGSTQSATTGGLARPVPETLSAAPQDVRMERAVPPGTPASEPQRHAPLRSHDPRARQRQD